MAKDRIAALITATTYTAHAVPTSAGAIRDNVFDTVDPSMDSGTLDIMASAKWVRSGRRSATPRTRRVGSSKQLAIRQTCSRFLLDGTTVVADQVPSEMPRQLLIEQTARGPRTPAFSLHASGGRLQRLVLQLTDALHGRRCIEDAAKSLIHSALSRECRGHVWLNQNDVRSGTITLTYLPRTPPFIEAKSYSGRSSSL